MGFLSGLKAWAERRSAGGGLGPRDGAYGLSGLVPTPVLSGVAVTPETALTFTAAFACINALSTDLASLPLSVKRRRPGGGSVTMPRDPRHTLVYCEPNGDTTAMRFRQALYGHRFGWGNGYAEIDRIKQGRRAGLPGALWLHSPRPTDSWPERSRNRKLWYLLDGGRRAVRSEDVAHIAGFGFNGIVGYSPIALHRQAVGYGKALEEYGAAFYGNSATPKGALKLKREATPELVRNLRESFGNVHQGTANAHRLMILEEDMDFQPMSMSPDDAQYIAVRQFQTIEMCRIFRVPPPRIQDYTGVTGVYKGFSDLIDDYVASTLGPEVEGAQQEWDRKLFTAGERARGYHVAHDFSALLRGNAKERMDYLLKRFSAGSITPDEIREREGDNPTPGPAGNQVFISSTYVPIDRAGRVPAPARPPAAPPPGPGEAEGVGEGEVGDDGGEPGEGSDDAQR